MILNVLEKAPSNNFWEWLVNYIYSFIGIDIIMDATSKGQPVPVQGYIQVVFSSLIFLLGLLTVHRILYIILGIFGKPKKYPEAPKDKRYAFIITARNEEKVIGNLIHCIRELDYPQDLIEIFICADNCSDNTGKIAEELGTHVYYHNNPKEKSKGYGLHYLIEEMRKEYDLRNDFYAYTTLDADNVPAPDYLTKMNNYLQASNVDEAVAYRNSKNISENWIAAMCGIQAFTHSETGLRARAILNTAQEIYGPSTTLRSHIIDELGWPWVTLTEDHEMVMDLNARGYKTGYTEEAVFYEEQPNTLKLLWRQRVRWSKGNLIAFYKLSPSLIKSFFKKPTWSKYDIFTQIFPYGLVIFWIGLLYQLSSIILYLCIGNSGYYDWSTFLTYVITLFTGAYVGTFIMDLIVIIREWRHILLPFWKVVLYLLLFPLYSVVNPIFSAATPFMKATWKHIDHHIVASGKNLREQENEKLNK